jgi:hypothetical protein
MARSAFVALDIIAIVLGVGLVVEVYALSKKGDQVYTQEGKIQH